MTKTGLYGIASLNGAPLDPNHLAVLGFAEPPAPRLIETGSFAVNIVDREEAGRAVHIVERDGLLLVLLGHLDEPADLAGMLGMDPASPSAELALAALERFGADAPHHMLGEWSLLRWRADRGELTLLMSQACRDPLYFAVDDGRVAVSAEMRRLTRLDWVGKAFDPNGLYLIWGKARLRRYMTEETPFRGVHRLMPGSRETFDSAGRRTLRLAPIPEFEPWRGTFDEALEAIETVLRRIVGQHLGRHGRAVSLLSGGLDSSLLAWLASLERREGQGMSFLTSVAPDGCGAPDEREESRIVADHLGLPIRFLAPDAGANPYLPADRMFAHSELPVTSPRHYLYAALYDAARDEGAELLLDGVYGELTVTNPVLLAGAPTSLRRFKRLYRDWKREWEERRSWPAGLFHTRLSPAALSALSSTIGHDWAAPFESLPTVRPDSMWGVRAGASKNAMTPTSSPDGNLRHVMPFRDRRLLNLVATMPAAYMEHGGLTRAPARLLLKDRLPDGIRLRRDGKPFSPDFMDRLRTYALPTIKYIDDFSAAGAGEWIDLEWLRNRLTTISNQADIAVQEAAEVQSTAVAAAYFKWWADQ
ncbi:MAG: asparagine synthase-related protein [Sphingomonas bacterium]